MLLYSKKVDDKNIVFYSENGIPTSDDIELTYKDDSGSEVDVYALSYFYNKDKGMAGGESKTQLPLQTDKNINVYAGDTLIIGKGVSNEIEPDGPSVDPVVPEPENPDLVELEVNKVSGVQILFSATPPAGNPGDVISFTIQPETGYSISNVIASYNEVEVPLTESGLIYEGEIALVAGATILTIAASVSEN